MPGWERPSAVQREWLVAFSTAKARKASRMPTNKAIRQANRVARAGASRMPHQPRCAMWPDDCSYAFYPSARLMARSKSCASMGIWVNVPTLLPRSAFTSDNRVIVLGPHVQGVLAHGDDFSL